MSHGIPHEMELAALPRHPGEDSLTGGFESCVIVADDEFDAVRTAGGEAFEELPPVRLSLGERYAAPRMLMSPIARSCQAPSCSSGLTAARLTCVEVMSDAAEFLNDGRDLSGAEALYLQLSSGQGQRPFAADV